MPKSLERIIYYGIKQRCFNKNNPQYKDYGGRGIKVCERWLESFENFYEDMGKRPGKEYSIDRIDNNGDYCKENCRWATRTEQSNNSRRNHIIEYDGKKLTISQWAKETGIHEKVIRRRIRLGWSEDKILSTPITKIYRKLDKLLTYNGLTYSISEWSKLTGIPRNILQSRKQRGWVHEDIISKPYIKKEIDDLFTDNINNQKSY